MDLSEVKKIYFIGIGGIGMSAAAGIAAEAGFVVSGSDSKEIYDPARSVLDKFGIEYTVGYASENVINAEADLYIVSAGEGLENSEVRYLEDNDLPLHGFSELLYELNKDRLRIVVAGTNGKSTTAGLIGHILHNIDDSTFMTGAVLQHYHTNFEYGTGHYAVFEGDEYKTLYNDPTPKFHQYKPDILVLTNLEFDHPDLFASFEQMSAEFEQLISDLPDDGLIIYNADDANLAKLMHKTNLANFGFSLQQASDYPVSGIHYGPEETLFKVKDEMYRTRLAGEMNVYNAVAAITLLRALGFSQKQIQDQLSSYDGLKRRFEKIGTTKSGVTIYDDYAHHPTAIEQTLVAARTRYPDRTVWAVFEPHTFSRTKATLDELAISFEQANQVLLAEIYPAREIKDSASITGQEVVDAVSKHHQHVRLVPDKAAAREILKAETKPGDVVIIMAVGSFNALAYDLLEIL